MPRRQPHEKFDNARVFDGMLLQTFDIPAEGGGGPGDKGASAVWLCRVAWQAWWLGAAFGDATAPIQPKIRPLLFTIFKRPFEKEQAAWQVDGASERWALPG
jgi:hypothetical protein